jgi:hypothetical protein
VIDIGSNNGTVITANNDMVQEVEVKTSNYMAEYGAPVYRSAPLRKAEAGIITAASTITFVIADFKRETAPGPLAGLRAPKANFNIRAATSAVL